MLLCHCLGRKGSTGHCLLAKGKELREEMDFTVVWKRMLEAEGLPRYWEFPEVRPWNCVDISCATH